MNKNEPTHFIEQVVGCSTKIINYYCGDIRELYEYLQSTEECKNLKTIAIFKIYLHATRK